MMKRFFIMRHGDATLNEMMPGRPLSELGIEETKRVGRELKRRQISFEKIWHSTRLRTEQTAQIIAEELGVPGDRIEKRDGLGPNDAPDAFRHSLELAFEDGIQNLLVVGHLPFIPDLLQILVKSKKSLAGILFTESSLLCLEPEDDQFWKVAWFITPCSLEQEKDRS